MTSERIEYNVFCGKCGHTWQPTFNSTLWWKAHKRADKGYLDAYCATGIECGCDQARLKPQAPFRVFGYTMDCIDFDIPTDTFTEAIRAFKERRNCGMIFIEGVSQKVLNHLEYSF